MLQLLQTLQLRYLLQIKPQLTEGLHVHPKGASAGRALGLSPGPGEANMPCLGLTRQNHLLDAIQAELVAAAQRDRLIKEVNANLKEA